jgi:DNA segregation ATPase FtsK/SpoIIIE, S-DNA-T family
VPSYLEAVTEDDDEEGEEGADGEEISESGNELYDQAVAIVLRDRKASTSYVQRRLGIGYNRAASLVERMENEGLIGPANHAGRREILVGGDEAATPY